MRNEEITLAEVDAYLHLFHEELGTSDVPLERLAQVREEIMRRGTYTQTNKELSYGNKMAWRNVPQCLGKFYWNSLIVHDRRDISNALGIFDALVDHLRFATNRGKIRLLSTIFAAQEPGRQGIRIWNPQLISYAGYRQPNGSVIGDPLHAEFTDVVRALGWRGGDGTPFDVLPLVIQMPHQEPKVFELPRDAILEVVLSHPDYPWFEGLGLKWYVHPSIANMRLEIGGVSYTAAPFSGWYTCAEIGARNLSDANRYNMLPVIAQKMGLDTQSDRTLWKDRALVELTVVVMHSFTLHGVSIIDHHYATRQFVRHEERERLMGRITPAQWAAIVPSLSPSTTAVFHRTYEEVILKPNYFMQPDPWRQCAMTP